MSTSRFVATGAAALVVLSGVLVQVSGQTCLIEPIDRMSANAGTEGTLFKVFGEWDLTSPKFEWYCHWQGATGPIKAVIDLVENSLECSVKATSPLPRVRALQVKRVNIEDGHSSCYSAGGVGEDVVSFKTVSTNYTCDQPVVTSFSTTRGAPDSWFTMEVTNLWVTPSTTVRCHWQGWSDPSVNPATVVSLDGTSGHGIVKCRVSDLRKAMVEGTELPLTAALSLRVSNNGGDCYADSTPFEIVDRCAGVAAPVLVARPNVTRVGLRVTVSGDWDWSLFTNYRVWLHFQGWTPPGLGPYTPNADGSVTGTVPTSPVGTYPYRASVQVRVQDLDSGETCYSAFNGADYIDVSEFDAAPSDTEARGMLIRQGGFYVGETQASRVGFEAAGSQLVVVAKEVQLGGELGGLKKLLNTILTRLDKLEEAIVR